MRSLRFNFPVVSSPTEINLSRYLSAAGWKKTRLLQRAHFGAENLEFNTAIAQTLEYKHRLADLVNKYCPEVMPLTYPIHDGNWREVLQGLPSAIKTWILKPALLNNGQYIKIFDQINDLEAHFKSSSRLGGEHVLQQYITFPHLLRDNRKYSLRQFVVLTHYSGVFLFHRGYFNIALHPYKFDDFSDLSIHLTNEHLFEHTKNTLQIPSHLFEFYDRIFEQIKNLLTAVFRGLFTEYSTILNIKKPQIALLGFDFMLDNSERVWLLEANHGPCFPINLEHPLQEAVYDDFWKKLISHFVEPLAQNEYHIKQSESFIPLNLR